jgi:cytochrome c5
MKHAGFCALLTILVSIAGPAALSAGDPEAVQAAREPAPAVEGANRATTPAPNDDDRSLGERVFQQNCLTCHGTGVGGAPVIGNAELWEARIAQGLDVLVEHAINGHRGHSGYMPPKGGFNSLTDEQVAAAVAYVVDQSRELLPELESLSQKCGTRERAVVCSDEEARKLLVLEMLWQMLGRPK